MESNTESATPPPPTPTLAAVLAADAATRGRAEFDADTYFAPGPADRPAERVIGVHQ